MTELSKTENLSFKSIQVGMKRADVKDPKDIKLFEKIDTNKDQVIQEQEILEYQLNKTELILAKSHAKTVLILGMSVERILTPPYFITTLEVIVCAVALFVNLVCKEYYATKVSQLKQKIEECKQNPEKIEELKTLVNDMIKDAKKSNEA